MFKKILIFSIFAIILFVSCEKPIKDEGIFATFYTNKGSFTCELFYKKVPVTVANFVGLAEGTREFTDPFTNNKIKRPFYNGLIFHRIIKDFIIQGGCPKGDGMGSPGKEYLFMDEFDDSLSHDSEGILSMANNAPNSNGSQFFITLSAAPYLNHKHSIFGKVVSGMDIIKKIGQLKTDKGQKPYQEVYIKKIKITKNGNEAKNFNANEIFEKRDEIFQKNINDKKFLKSLGFDLNKLINYQGYQYYIKNAGTGLKPAYGNDIIINYIFYNDNGSIIDSTYLKKEPYKSNINDLFPGLAIVLLNMREGDKRIVVMSNSIFFGDDSILPEISGKKEVIFDLELIKVIK